MITAAEFIKQTDNAFTEVAQKNIYISGDTVFFDIGGPALRGDNNLKQWFKAVKEI